MSNDNLINIRSRLISPGDSNALYKHCFAITYFQGKQLIAYGSGSNVIITSNTFSIIDELKGENPNSTVMAVAWATYSGRLSSFSSNQKDYQKIIIWEPNRSSGRWEILTKIKLDTEIICLSWSKGDNILCTASKQNFQIFNREENKRRNQTYSIDEKSNDNVTNNFLLKCVYTNNIPTEFCSHSRDSRFILTLPMRSNRTNKDQSINNQNSLKGVLIYYKRSKSDGDYNYVLIKHPYPVVSARWRTSDQSHGNCCFMTVSEDQVVRIWYETSVNESFKFSVVASLPSNRNILVASFISTSSKYIANNPLFDSDNDENEPEKVDDSNDAFIHLSKQYKDVYAYGNGHLVKRDGNYRESCIDDKNEASQNFFYFLTFDKFQSLAIWKVTGLSSNVRTTPKITQLVTKDIKLGIEPNTVNNIYAFCRLTSEYSHHGTKKYVPQPMTLSLILQNNLIGSLTSLDLSINSENLLLTNFVSIHGHRSSIKSIRINKDHPFMVTLGEKNKKNNDDHKYNEPFIWKFNETDVYDPSIIANFFYELDIQLEAVEWLYSKSKLIGFDGNSFMILRLIRSNAPIVNIIPNYIDFKFNNLYDQNNSNVLQFRVLCGNEEEKIHNYILSILFEHDFYLLHLNDMKIHELLHLQEKNDTFVDMCDNYISQLFHEAGALLCSIATKHKAYSIFLNKDIILSSTFGEPKIKISQAPASTVPKSKTMMALAPPKDSDKPKKSNQVASYSTIFETNEKEEIHSLCFIHPAYYLIACDYKIYVCRRFSCSSNDARPFQEISIDYIPKQIRCNPHGMVSVVSDDKIELFHQFRRSTEFGKSNMKWEKFAQEETKNISVAEWSLDGFLIYASNENIYALTKYMDTYFLDEEKMFATIHNSMASHSKGIQDMNPAILIPLSVSGRNDLVLNMLDYLNEHAENNRINTFYQDYVLNYNDESKKKYEKDVDALIDSLYNKAKMDLIKTFNERENEEFIHFISNLKKYLAIQPESLDQRSIAAARAIALDENHSIPFDLINLAYISHDQVKLMDFVNFQSWDSILNSGVFFWMKDLKVLIDKLVPFAINHFSTRKDISIIILSMTHKFVVLKTLFKKSGEEARAAFFGRDFSKPKEKKSAEKNGYSALSKHDFYTAAAMFVLSGNIQIAIRILMQNTPDIALAYLLCRYTEDKNQSLFKIIDDFLIPRATEVNDLAAIEFFKKQKDPDYQYSLDERIRSEKCGNLIASSNYFYDMRFVACEILQTTIEQKADLCLCFLLSGASFLNTVYLSYLGKYVFHKDDTPSQTIPSSHSAVFDFTSKFQNFTDESENETDETTEEPSDNETYVKEIDAFSFGGVTGSNFTYIDDDFSSSDDDFDSDSSTNEENQKEETENKKEQKEAENKKEQEEVESEKEQEERKPSEPLQVQPRSKISALHSNRRYSVFARQSSKANSPLISNAAEAQTNNNNPKLMNNSNVPSMTSPTKPKPSMVRFSGSNSNDNLESFPSTKNSLSGSNSNENLKSSSENDNNEQKDLIPSFQPGRASKPSFALQTHRSVPPSRRMSSYFASQISTLMNPSTSHLANKHESYLIDDNKSPKGANNIIIKTSNSAKLFKESHSEGSSDSDDNDDLRNSSQTVNLSVSQNGQKMQSQANWLLDVIVFNISRLRLEQFTTVQFSNDDNLLSLVRQKITEGSGNILSMMNHFNDYLIRSCKRRGIISRRLLLISNEGKQQFIQDVCHCITLLPDQLIASRFTKQGIAQISRTTQALVEIVKKNLIEKLDKSTMFLSVTAAILTATFIIALYKHDVKIMNKLMHVDLTESNPESFVESFKKFLGLGQEDNEIRDFLKVSFIPPGTYPPNLKYTSWRKTYVSFVSDEMKKYFINSKKCSNLSNYASSLIDFLIIDSFIKKIKDLKTNPLVKKAKKGFFKDNFNLLLLNLKKCYDVVTQLFTYSTINFPSFIEFNSLSDICENMDDNLNDFTNFLLSLENRRETVSKYTMNIIHKFSFNSSTNASSAFSSVGSSHSADNTNYKLSRIGSQNESNISTLNFSMLNDNIYSTHKVLNLTKLARNFRLIGLRNIASCNSSVYSIFLDGDKSSIFTATDNGVNKSNIPKVDKSSNKDEKSEEIFQDFNNDTEELTNEFQENENENEEENKNENQEENKNENQEENKNENENEQKQKVDDDISNEDSQISISEELPSSQSSAGTLSSKSRRSSSKKRAFTITSNKASKSAAPTLKLKTSTAEETPTCAVMSPTMQAILVGYKNGRVDLIKLADPQQKVLDSVLSETIRSEVSEFSESDNTRSKRRKSSDKSDEKSESTEATKSKRRKSNDKSDEKSESTEISKSKKGKSNDKSDEKSDKSESTSSSKSKKRKSTDKGDKIDKSESTETLTSSFKSKKRKSTDRGEKSESTETRKSESKGVTKSESNESMSESESKSKKTKSVTKSESSEKLKESKKSKSATKSESSEKLSKSSSQTVSPPSSPPSSSTKSKKKDAASSIHFEFQKIVTLKAPNNVACTALAFSNDGSLIAAAHKSTVSLWSLHTMSEDEKEKENGELPPAPFNVIDTFSEECTHIHFLKGTALIVTAQAESSRFKGNLCFWDALLPSRASLVASLELKEQFGRVLSLAYSPSFSKVFAGTSRGFTCVVDTKKFCIIEAISCFSKKAHEGVQSIAIDAQQMFLVTGSSSGNVKVFDAQDYTCLCEKEMVHAKKVLRSRGKLRDFAISAIAIDEKVIYTCGYDGNVKEMQMTLAAA